MSDIPAVIKPSFFVVGAQKAGTSSIHTWLKAQPGISLPRIKETHFFVDDTKFNYGEEWYGNLFEIGPESRLFGEVDPEYMYWPSAAERIRKVVEDPNIICVLRQPLARAYSHYLMSYRRGIERNNFRDALLLEESRKLRSTEEHYRLHYSYMERGNYVGQIQWLQATIPSAKILVIVFEDLFNPGMTESIFTNLLDFIGYNSKSVLNVLSRRENIASESRLRWLQQFANADRRSLVKRAARTIVRSPSIRAKVWTLIDGIGRVSKDPPKLGGISIPSSSIEQAKEQISATEDFLNRKLEKWRAELNLLSH